MKTVRTTLTGPDGGLLRLHAQLTRTGAARSFIVHESPKDGNGKRTSTRGASASHASMIEAQKAIETHVAAATKIGWQRSAPRTNHHDAFDAAHLPTPGKAPIIVKGK